MSNRDEILKIRSEEALCRLFSSYFSGMRAKLRLTQSEVVEDLRKIYPTKITQKSISYLESGKRMPSLWEAFILCIYYKTASGHSIFEDFYCSDCLYKLHSERNLQPDAKQIEHAIINLALLSSTPKSELIQDMKNAIAYLESNGPKQVS